MTKLQKIDLKKTFLIIGFILATLLIAFLLYQTFFKSYSDDLEYQQPNEENIQGELPGSGGKTDNNTTKETNDNGLIKSEDKINSSETPSSSQLNKNGENSDSTTEKNEKIISATKDSSDFFTSTNDNNIKYYNKTDNKFYQLDKNGNKGELSDKEFFDVKNVVWSPSNNEAVLTYPDGKKIIYDFNKEKQISLADHWDNFSYSSDGNKIAFKSTGATVDNI
jgi:hypothetical protein